MEAIEDLETRELYSADEVPDNLLEESSVDS